jgi:hypothetical protein
LLETEIKGAHSVLINIMGSNEALTMFEINEASTTIQEAADGDAEIMWGMSLDESLGDTVRVTIIATRFHNEAESFNVPMMSNIAQPQNQNHYQYHSLNQNQQRQNQQHQNQSYRNQQYQSPSGMSDPGNITPIKPIRGFAPPNFGFFAQQNNSQNQNDTPNPQEPKNLKQDSDGSINVPPWMS